jgi:hypothetical protein
MLKANDRLIPVTTADGYNSVLKAVAAKESGDRCILVKTADGYATPIKCRPINKSGQRGILVKTADGVMVPVTFEHIPQIIYAGGNFDVTSGKCISQWDGASWLPLGSGLNSTCTSLKLDSAGNLYAVGAFTTAGGNTANRIAVWDGSEWSTLGSGFNGTVHSIAIDSNDIIYCGGDFTTAGGNTANYIAQWSGSAWSQVGDGFDGAVLSIDVDSANNLYACGNMTASGSTTLYYAAKWNGSAWSSLGSAFYYPNSGSWRSIAVDSSGNIYAAGTVYIEDPYGGMSLVAKWNGSTWDDVGDPFTNVEVHQYDGTLYVIDIDSSDNIYCGGNYNDGVIGVCITRWTGSEWEMIGGGVNNTVRAISFDEENNLYIGGEFYPPSLNHIGKYDGSSLSNIGAGISGGIYSIAVKQI